MQGLFGVFIKHIKKIVLALLDVWSDKQGGRKTRESEIKSVREAQRGRKRERERKRQR